MREKQMVKGKWYRMTPEEWMVAYRIGGERDDKNRREGAADHSVDDRMLNPYESKARTRKAMICELCSCKNFDVYPDLQNEIKVKWDLVVDGITIDVKTPVKATGPESPTTSEWVAVPEKCGNNPTQVYLFVWCKVPVNGARWNEDVFGCKCLGYATKDMMYAPENHLRMPGKTAGYFMRRDELLSTWEEVIDALNKTS